MRTLKAINLQHPTSSTINMVLASDGSVSGGLPSANRNLLYNGAMQVAQRSSSVAGIITQGYYTADRWQLFCNTLGTWTQSIENDAPTGSGFAKSLKMLCTVADAAPSADDWCFFEQALEGQDLQRIAKGTSSAMQLNLSFWVKSNKIGTYVVNLTDADNSREVAAQYSISSSATWERKAITFPIDTIGAFINDNTTALGVRFGLAIGANRSSGTLPATWQSAVTANLFVGQTNLAATINNYLQVTGVQLETGPVATSFEFKSYGQELRECQRYYYQYVSGNAKIIGVGSMLASNVADSTVRFPVTMRIAPTLIATSGTNYYNFYRNAGDDLCNSLTIDSATNDAAGVRNFTEISGTAGHAGAFYTANAASSVAFNAEL